MKNIEFYRKMTVLASGWLGFALASLSQAGSATSSPPSPVQLSAEATQESTDPFGATLTLGYDSNYVFRGVDLGGDLLSAELRLSYDFSDKWNLQLGSWFGAPVETKYREFDLAAVLTYDFGPVQVAGQAFWYHFPRGYYLDNQYELGLEVSTATGPLDWTVTYAHEFEVEGDYVELAVSSDIALHEKVTLTPAVMLGAQSDYNAEGEGWNHVGLQLSADIELSEHVTLSPYIAGLVALDAIDDYQKDLVYGGVKLSVSF